MSGLAIRGPNFQSAAQRFQGFSHPSGGAVQRWVGLWRTLAPSRSAIAPDIYGNDPGFVRDVLAAYHRLDNPLPGPEIAKPDAFAKYDFLILGNGAVGVALVRH